MICPKSKLSIRRQCQLLSISRASFYYSPKQEKADNLEMMQLMDSHILQEPTAGVLTMQSMLEEAGCKAGYERVRRLMRLANIRRYIPQKASDTAGRSAVYLSLSAEESESEGEKSGLGH